MNEYRMSDRTYKRALQRAFEDGRRFEREQQSVAEEAWSCLECHDTIIGPHYHRDTPDGTEIVREGPMDSPRWSESARMMRALAALSKEAQRE